MFKQRREIQKDYDSTIEKVNSQLEELTCLQAGQFTLSSFWKSKASKQELISFKLGQKDAWLASVANTRLYF